MWWVGAGFGAEWCVEVEVWRWRCGSDLCVACVQALAPVMALPKLIQYPLLLLIFGAISFPFTFLFGSGSLGGSLADKPSSATAPPAQVASPAPGSPPPLARACGPTFDWHLLMCAICERGDALACLRDWSDCCLNPL